jgi:hypothetical protein
VTKAVTLQLLDSMKIFTFHVSGLRPYYRDDSIPRQSNVLGNCSRIITQTGDGERAQE